MVQRPELPFRHQQRRLGELLVELGFLKSDQLTHALQQQAQTGMRLGKILVEQGFVTEAGLTRALSRQLGLHVCQPVTTPIHQRVIAMVPRDFAYRHHVMPIGLKKGTRGDVLYVATSDPTNQEILPVLERTTGHAIELLLAGETQIDLALARYYGTAIPDVVLRESELPEAVLEIPSYIDEASDRPHAMGSPPTAAWGNPPENTHREASATKVVAHSVRLPSSPGVAPKRPPGGPPDALQPLELPPLPSIAMPTSFAMPPINDAKTEPRAFPAGRMPSSIPRVRAQTVELPEGTGSLAEDRGGANPIIADLSMTPMPNLYLKSQRRDEPLLVSEADRASERVLVLSPDDEVKSEVGFVSVTSISPDLLSVGGPEESPTTRLREILARFLNRSSTLAPDEERWLLRLVVRALLSRGILDERALLSSLTEAAPSRDR